MEAAVANPTKRFERTKSPSKPRRFGPVRRVCRLCENKVVLDYKSFQDLKPFVNRLGKILPRRASRLCAKHQRSMALQVRRARYVGLLPYVAEPETIGDRDKRRPRGGPRSGPRRS